MPAIEISSPHANLTGFRYFWMKSVTGFDPSVHCARCLRGNYEKVIGSKMPTNQRLDLGGYTEGAVLYLCGVSAPYRWASNAHLAVKVKKGAVATVTLYTGDVVQMFDCIALPFDDKVARERFPERSIAFLSCRNFQFAAQYF